MIMFILVIKVFLCYIALSTASGRFNESEANNRSRRGKSMIMLKIKSD